MPSSSQHATLWVVAHHILPLCLHMFQPRPLHHDATDPVGFPSGCCLCRWVSWPSLHATFIPNSKCLYPHHISRVRDPPPNHECVFGALLCQKEDVVLRSIAPGMTHMRSLSPASPTPPGLCLTTPPTLPSLNRQPLSCLQQNTNLLHPLPKPLEMLQLKPTSGKKQRITFPVISPPAHPPPASH